MQIHFIGRYGASHPLQETYVINTECKECFPTVSCIPMMVLTSIKHYNLIYTVDAQSIGFECQRWWRTDSEDINERISFNLTWVLPPYISRGHVISNFVVDLKLLNTVEDITIPMESITVTFREVRLIHNVMTLFNL